MFIFFSSNKKDLFEKEIKLAHIPTTHRNCTVAEIN